MHDGRACAKEVSVLNARPRCAGHCLTPALDVGSHRGDFAEEVLESISCIKFPPVPTPTKLWGVMPRALPFATEVVSATSAAIPVALQM